jgi:hypothetical protein
VLYIPYNQGYPQPEEVVFELRSRGDPLVYVNAIREIVYRADSRMPLFTVKTERAEMDQSVQGLAIGLPAALALSKLVKTFLFGMQPNDPLSIVGAAATLLAAAILASYAPAHRASRIDPMVALRHE